MPEEDIKELEDYLEDIVDVSEEDDDVMTIDEIAALFAVNGEDNQEKLNLFSSKDEIIKELCKLSLYDIIIDEVPLIIDGTKKTYYNLRAVIPADKVLSQGEIDILVRSLKQRYCIKKNK